MFFLSFDNFYYPNCSRFFWNILNAESTVWPRNIHLFSRHCFKEYRYWKILPKFWGKLIKWMCYLHSSLSLLIFEYILSIDPTCWIFLRFHFVMSMQMFMLLKVGYIHQYIILDSSKSMMLRCLYWMLMLKLWILWKSKTVTCFEIDFCLELFFIGSLEPEIKHHQYVDNYFIIL